jgi:hypothetical protein
MRVAVPLIAIALMSAGSAASAATTVLNFDGLRGRNGSTGYVYGPYSEQGYTLGANRCSNSNTCFVTTGTSRTSLDRDGAALVNYLGSAVSTIRRTDGSAFMLDSIDMASNYGNSSGFGQPTLGVRFTFAFADGQSQVVDYTLANTPGEWLTVNTLRFDLAPLVSFSWTPTTNSSGFVQFDNVALSDVSAAVPEPASWAVMVAGFGMAGGALRRRSRVAAAARA